MPTLMEKAKANRTRPADIDGDPVRVRVHSAAKLETIKAAMMDGSDKEKAETLAAQFIDESGSPAYTAEFLMSDDCPNCFIAELARLFMEVNSGMYKKK